MTVKDRLNKEIDLMLGQEQENLKLQTDKDFQHKLRRKLSQLDRIEAEENKPENVMGRWVTMMVKLEAMKAANQLTLHYGGTPKYLEPHFMELLGDNDG